MEHLLSPPGTKRILIPYLGGKTCEEFVHPTDNHVRTEFDVQRLFKDFPNTYGWSINSIGEINCQDKTAKEILVFVQTWLYFGTLISVFQVARMPLRTMSFLQEVDGKIYLNTENVQYLITMWMRGEAATVETEAQRINYHWTKAARSGTIREILSYASVFFPTLIAEARKRPDAHETSVDATELAVMAACETLTTALRQIYGSTSEPQAVLIWGPSKLLQDRLRQYGCWSDGLGNDNKQNSMHKCQLSRIQKLVDALYPDTAGSTGFWIDTLCVPVGEHNVHLRGAAIRKMADVYREADRVLVLDSFVLESSSRATLVEKYIRIHLSNWHHRLWTLQEGQLAKSLYFQFYDGAQSFHDMRGHMPEPNHKYTDASTICSPIVYTSAIELERFYRYFETKSGTEDIANRMRSCAKYLRGRETSRKEDETLCVSTVLGLKPGPLIPAKTAGDRMAVFYDMIERFDPTIVFHNYPRLQKTGYGWAPSSFLQQTMVELFPDTGSVRPDPVHIIPGGGGICVEFPGIELHGVGPHLGKSVEIILKEDTAPPAHLSIFQSAPLEMKHMWAMRRPPVPWWILKRKIELLPDAQGVIHTWDPSQRYFVVMLRDLRRQHSLGDIEAIIGVVESLENRGNTTDISLLPLLSHTLPQTNPAEWMPIHFISQTIVLRYICNARISTILPDINQGSYLARTMFGYQLKPESNEISGTAYSQMQKWRIR
ncbi:hypothetical protein ABW20_dc0105914 [Dactylellina cionopaga]|nr:hypothetical protein ABW20_dc0105914 [Dactylellina cionopaga]